ncbi:MAG: hydroxymethylbilane synthase, partial [Gammaproteobacteria bacterium]|nr:hydroxymethylbilane synthase [Gammaproteobacteria bacterium]
RGNVNSRLEKLANNEFDAIILAAAGLIRLGFSDQITAFMDVEQSLPAIGQGAVGIECRQNDPEIAALLTPLHDTATALRIRAERALNQRLHGGCQVPIAGFALLNKGQIRLRGMVGQPDGKRIIRAEKTGSSQNPEELGRAVAEDLLAQGADKILAELDIYPE